MLWQDSSQTLFESKKFSPTHFRLFWCLIYTTFQLLATFLLSRLQHAAVCVLKYTYVLVLFYQNRKWSPPIWQPLPSCPMEPL